MTTNWIQTYTGKQFFFDNITPEIIDIEDIAHALALTNRFCGHTSWPYSVAQHSLLVAQNVSEDYALEGLLHDAAEAYCHDLTAPLKRVLGMGKGLAGYDKIQERIEEVIEKKFGLAPRWKWYHEVRRADLRALATERRDLFNGKGFDFDWGLQGIEPFEDEIQEQDWVVVRAEFTCQARELLAKRGVK